MDRSRPRISPSAARVIDVVNRLFSTVPVRESSPGWEASTAVIEGLTAPEWQLIAERCAQLSLQTMLQAGGMWPQSRWIAGRPQQGTVWELWPAETLGLTFTANSAELLLRLTVEPSQAPSLPWKLHGNASLGDRWLAWLVVRHCQGTPWADWVWQCPELRHDGMLWLLFPQEISRQRVASPTNSPDFSSWTSTAGQAWGSCLLRQASTFWCQRIQQRQVLLADEVRATELDIQQRAARVWLAECDRLELRELTFWLLPVLQQAAQLAETATSRSSMNAESTAYSELNVLLELVNELAQWTRRCRLTGYLDDGYAAAQFWLRQWEAARGTEWLAAAREIAGRTQSQATALSP